MPRDTVDHDPHTTFDAARRAFLRAFVEYRRAVPTLQAAIEADATHRAMRGIAEIGGHD